MNSNEDKETIGEQRSEHESNAQRSAAEPITFEELDAWLGEHPELAIQAANKIGYQLLSMSFDRGEGGMVVVFRVDAPTLLKPVETDLSIATLEGISRERLVHVRIEHLPDEHRFKAF